MPSQDTIWQTKLGKVWEIFLKFSQDYGLHHITNGRHKRTRVLEKDPKPTEADLCAVLFPHHYRRPMGKIN